MSPCSSPASDVTQNSNMNITPDPSPPIELPLELVWRVWEESADNLPHLATLAQFMGSVHRERIEQVMYHTIVIRTQWDWMRVFRKENRDKISKWTVHLVVVENELFGWWGLEEYHEWKSFLGVMAEAETANKRSLTVKRNKYLSDHLEMVFADLPTHRVCLLGPTRKGLDAEDVSLDLEQRVRGHLPWPHVLEYKGVRPWSEGRRVSVLGVSEPEVFQPPEDLQVVLWLEGNEGIDEHRQGMDRWVSEVSQHTVEADAVGVRVVELLRGSDVRVSKGPKSWDLVERWGGEEESKENIHRRAMDLAAMSL